MKTALCALGAEMTADDITRFERYLAGRRRVPQRRIPYYVHWVKRYLRFRAAADPALSSERVRSLYRDHLAKSKLDWQVIQTDDAVSAFLQFSERSEHAPSEHGTD